MKIQKSQKTAILFGATGLVGGYCLKFLLESPLYSKVKTFNRRKLNIDHPKYEEYIIDFDKLEDYAGWMIGEDVFCCLGTTRKKAGSKAAFSKVDYTYVLKAAKLTAKNKANQFLLVSAVGADKDSMFFYNQIKGEIESSIQNLNFWSIHIFRPSLLLGSRNELRVGEKLAMYASSIFNLVTNKLAPKYSAVHGEQVAKTMILAAQRIDGGTFIYESDEIQQF